MNIGIISMQRIHNYGSFLQSYALKKTIESLGHNCYFIDYRPGKKIIEKKEKISKFVYYVKKIDLRAINRIKHYIYHIKRKKMFINVLSRYLSVNQFDYDKYCDIAVIGSDEVFNCIQDSYWGLSEMLFGSNINCKKVISYAASFGNTNINDIKKYNLQKEISGYLNNFSALSVRDKNSYDIICELTAKLPIIHIDPVFLFDFEYSNIGSLNLSNYILVYAYDNRITDLEIKSIRNFAQKVNKKIISAGVFQWWCDKNILVEPFKLINYFKKADYIITDTFHGCALSIKYNKNFCVYIRESNKNKIADLLNKFYLDHKHISYQTDLSIAFSKKIDYNIINKKIEEEKKSAITYLKENLTLELK